MTGFLRARLPRVVVLWALVMGPLDSGGVCCLAPILYMVCSIQYIVGMYWLPD